MYLRQIAKKVLGPLANRNLPDQIASLDNQTFIDFSYQFVLRRKPDTYGRSHYLGRLDSQDMSRDHLLDTLIDSPEFSSELRYHNLGTSLHESRVRFVRQLPKANRIVDLGGSCQNEDAGALVSMGYPYSFDRLTIVDLPIEQRHQLYQNNREVGAVQTAQGTVDYLYQSMADLNPIESQSVDLVYSGESIEHVSIEDAAKVFREVMRVLRPGGVFALDTPNGRITRLQQDHFVDPDHKVEYLHADLNRDLISAGFDVCEAKGLNLAGAINNRSEFCPEKVAKNCGIFADIENCYLLAYTCRKPSSSSIN